jgi:hypothetical protein
MRVTKAQGTHLVVYMSYTSFLQVKTVKLLSSRTQVNERRLSKVIIGVNSKDSSTSCSWR